MDLSTVGGRLSWARELAGVSARDLARRAGLKSETHVRNIEKGRMRSIRSDIATQIAAALGVPLDWLLTGAGVTPSVQRLAAEESGEHPSVDATGTGEG